MQNIFKKNLNEISKGTFQSEQQKSVLENIKLFYESRQAVVKLFNECSSIASEAKYKTKYGEGFEILTPKQKVQRLRIAMAQVKAANTSETY